MTATYRTSATDGGTSGTGDRTCSIAAVLGDLLIVFVSGVNASPGSWGVTDSTGATYVNLGGLTSASPSNLSCVAFVCTTLVAANATITVTAGIGSNDAAQIGVVAVAGMQRAGVGAIRSYGKAASSDPWTPEVTLSRAPLTANPTLVAFASGDTTTTPPTNWTERIDGSQTTPTTALEVATRDSGATSSTVTWGAASSTGGVAIALELDSSPMGEWMLVGKQEITISGTWSPTTGATAARVRFIGGGGAGGAGHTTNGASGGGGCSGEYVELWIPGTSQLTGGFVTVGSGGTPASGADGGAGGNTSIAVNGTTYTAQGGSGGLSASTATATASFSKITSLGSSGEDVMRNVWIGEANRTFAGSSATLAGNGASSPFGEGGDGSWSSTGSTGGDGKGYGTGGGGGRRGSGGSNQAGGAGMQGIIIIEEYKFVPTALEIADAVWDEARAGHVTAGSFGEGVVVNSIAASAITATAIASNAITSAKIASSAIGASQIASNAITSAKIATDAIGAAQIANDAVTEIQNGLATAAALATVDNVVDSILADTDAIDARLPSDPADQSAVEAAIDSAEAAILAAIDDIPVSQTTFVRSMVNLGDTLTSIVLIVDESNAPADPDGGADPVLSVVDDAGDPVNLTGLVSWTNLDVGEWQVTLTISAPFAVDTAYAAKVTATVDTVDIEGVPTGFPGFEVIEPLATETQVDGVEAKIDIIDTNVDSVLADTAAIDGRLPSDPADASVVAGLIAGVDAKVDIVDFNVDAILADTAAIDARLPSDPADASVVAGLIAATEAKVDIIDTNVDALTTTVDSLTTDLAALSASVLRLLGLAHENSMVDNWTYDGFGNASGCRIRQFANAGAIPATPGGSEGTEIARWVMSASFSALGVCTSYEMEKQL